MKLKSIISTAILVLSCAFVFATTTTVNTLNELTDAFSNALPGDVIIVENGTYNWGKITLVNNEGSSNSAWITVKAQSTSGVVFTGNTYIAFSGNRIVVDGFKFANGSAGTNPVIAFRSTTTTFANYSRVTNITIDNYNTLSADTTTENEWIGFFGVRNRLDHCNFYNKSNPRATVVVWYSTATFPEKSVSTYHLIDSNYFAGRTYMGGNGGETIRVGVGNNSTTDGYNVIEYNLFEGCIQTEPEIVSNKSAYNTYRYNTFKNCNGGLTLRMGKRCNVYGNYFIVNDATKTDSYGVRIIDLGHKVYNNYFEGLLGSSGDLTTMRFPIVIVNGTFATADSLNPGVLDGQYLPADSALVAYNTVVNCKGGGGINIGYNSSGANPYQPKGLKISNNLIKMTTGQAVYKASTNTSLTYSAEGNVYNAPSGLGMSTSVGFSSRSLNFGSRSNGILPPPTSNVQDASVNTNFYKAIIGNFDAQGQIRSATFDIGCDELNGIGNITYGPLDSTKVGAGKGVNYIAQTITFPAIPVKSLGDADFNPGATASSGLSISYTSSNTAVATIVDNQIHIVGSGTTIITAYQNGDNSFTPAAAVTQNFVVRTSFTYSPSSTTILSGSGCNCGLGNLATNNDVYFKVNSTTIGTKKTDWFGSVTINQQPSTINKLTINYDGKNSTPLTQVLYLYNWNSADWVQINSSSVNASDVFLTYTENNPTNYISTNGEIRVRVYNSGSSSSFITFGDLMEFVVESSSTSRFASTSSNTSNTSTTISSSGIGLENVMVYENPDLSSEQIVDYQLNESNSVEIKLMDKKGTLVKQIMTKQIQEAGNYKVKIDSNNLTTGSYIIEVKAGKFAQTLKLDINN